jgi:hypothetical protein
MGKRSLWIAMAAILVPAALIAQVPAWRYQKIDDAIAAKSSGVFTLIGKWAGPAPSFPYQDAIPRLSVACQNGKMNFSGFRTDAQLDSSRSAMEFRIDDVQGIFRFLYPADPGDGSAFFRPADFQKIIHAHKVTLRVFAYRDGYYTMQFDMPQDIAQLADFGSEPFWLP